MNRISTVTVMQEMSGAETDLLDDVLTIVHDLLNRGPVYVVRRLETV